MQVFYLMLVASSAVCAESTASSSTAAHDYQVTVRSFAGDQDNTPPTSSMPSDGTSDDEVRVTTYFDRLASKLAVILSKFQGKNRNTLFLALTDGSERSRDGIVKMLKDPKMKPAMKRYPRALIEKILVLFDSVDLALALAQVQRTGNEVAAEFATTLSHEQFQPWMGPWEDVVGTFFQHLNLGSIKSDEYRDFPWKVMVLDDFITAWKRWKDNTKKPIRAVNSELVNKKEVVDALTKGFGGVSEFVSVIGGALRSADQGVVVMGKRLSQDMQEVWMTKPNEFSPEAVVASMKLAGDREIFTEENMQMLSAYIARYRKEETKPTHLIEALIKGFGGVIQLDKVLSKRPEVHEVIDRWCIHKLLDMYRAKSDVDTPESSLVNAHKELSLVFSNAHKEQARKTQNRLRGSSLSIW